MPGWLWDPSVCISQRFVRRAGLLAYFLGGKWQTTFRLIGWATDGGQISFGQKNLINAALNRIFFNIYVVCAYQNSTNILDIFRVILPGEVFAHKGWILDMCVILIIPCNQNKFKQCILVLIITYSSLQWRLYPPGNTSLRWGHE